MTLSKINLNSLVTYFSRCQSNPSRIRSYTVYYWRFFAYFELNKTERVPLSNHRADRIFDSVSYLLENRCERISERIVLTVSEIGSFENIEKKLYFQYFCIYICICKNLTFRIFFNKLN